MGVGIPLARFENTGFGVWKNPGKVILSLCIPGPGKRKKADSNEARYNRTGSGADTLNGGWDGE